MPVAWWAAGGRRAGAVAAAVVAVCPFLTYYAQEARMYTLVAVLSLVATAAFVRRRPVVLVVALTLLLYTHTWGVFLFAGARGRLARARPRPRPACCAGASAAVLYLPWVPSLISQALHTGAPWSVPPSVLYLLPAVAAVGVAPARRAGPRRPPPASRSRGWPRRSTPAWSPRYLFVLFGPVLLVVARAPSRMAPIGRGGAGRGVLLAGPPAAKSNARAVAASVAPSVRAGDLVVVTQPEQVPVLHRYLPAGVRYLTPLGPPADPSLTDWRDALPRLRAARAERALLPYLRGLAPGRRVVLVTPVARRRARRGVARSGGGRASGEPRCAAIRGCARWARPRDRPGALPQRDPGRALRGRS